MKKVIALVLAVATVASLSISAFAAKTDVVLDSMVTGKTDAKLIGDKIAPDKTLYYAVDNKYNSEDDYKVKFTKGDNSKLIKKISMVEKDITGDVAREYCVKIELNDDMTDKEYKMNPKVTFTGKKDSNIKDEFSFKFWISNTEKVGDNTWTAGTGGFIAKPTKNDDNEVIWENDNKDIAKLTFSADSDVSKYFPKLSTKWDNAEYAAKFADQDAYIFSFVGNPSISATSRPVLTIYNPYVNDDDEVTVAAEDVVIYELVDGALIDATAKFTATTNDDGDSVFTTKTRTLGTYIFAQAAATEAAAEEVPATDDGKVVPNTGR
ncbi:hypothetical protein V6615_08580 [Oscillospiraceae bacterium PP1C4]